MKFLTCTDVSFSYEKTPVIKDINFELKKGDYLCIVGENGSGKSTLMRGLLGLIPLHHGKININEVLNSNEIGYLPQQTIVQRDFPASVYEIVLSGRINSCGLRPFYNKKDKEIVNKNMKKLNVDSIKSASFRELSGGQQQRVLLCRALCATEKILFLDEPVSGLDPIVTEDLYKTIEEINESGITIVMISHDVHNAVKYASHILHLNNSQLFYGTTKDYLDTDIAKKFLGSDRYV